MKYLVMTILFVTFYSCYSFSSQCSKYLVDDLTQKQIEIHLEAIERMASIYLAGSELEVLNDLKKGTKIFEDLTPEEVKKISDTVTESLMLNYLSIQELQNSSPTRSFIDNLLRICLGCNNARFSRLRSSVSELKSFEIIFNLNKHILFNFLRSNLNAIVLNSSKYYLINNHEALVDPNNSLDYAAGAGIRNEFSRLLVSH